MKQNVFHLPYLLTNYFASKMRGLAKLRMFYLLPAGYFEADNKCGDSICGVASL